MVVSISAVPSAAAARDYYGKDNYYAKGAGDAEPSAWFGRGAQALGLKGAVDPDLFERVLKGETLDGRRVGQRADETLAQAEKRLDARPHRPGVDLTFSPPKEVSLLLYLGEDRRLLGAHRRAIDATLKWAERNLAGARLRAPLPGGGKGKAEPVKTGNFVVAKFEHDISRDKDPQLHTHAVVANMTQTADGRWRALYNDPLFAHRKLLSLAYDASMREETRKLGYRVTLVDGKSGAWSIEGVPGAAKQEFSKGAERINKAAEKLDHPTPAAKAVLAVKTRPSKTRLSQAEREASWRERGAPWLAEIKGAAADAALRAEAGRAERPLNAEKAERAGAAGLLRRMGQNFFRPTHTLRLEENDPYAMDRAGSQREYAARAAVSFALRHLEEREAAFSLHHARRAALEHAADGVVLRDIDKELRLLRRAGKIMAKAGDPDGLATTRRSLSHEARTRQLVASAGKAEPLMTDIAVRAALKDLALTPGQKAAIELIFAGDRRLVGVQGYAGAGKTTMMRHAKALIADLKPAAGKHGAPVLGLAPTHGARRELEASLGVEAQTVSQFLTAARKGETRNLAGAVVVVDESSFLSTRAMNRLLAALLPQNPARIVLAGDRRQHGAVEAGRPFDLAQRSGMATAIMKDVVRLPANASYDARRAAVIDAAEGRVAAAMNRLEANIVERPDGDVAAGAVAAWRALPKDVQADAMIVAPGHRIRSGVNAGVRQTMIAEGRLGRAAARLPVLQVKDLTRAEAASPRSYAAGDILSFHGRLDAVNAKKGAVRTVVSVDEPRGLVTLRNSKGGLQTIKTDRLAGRYESASFSLNREETLEIREHDKLLFTRSEREGDIAALTYARVKSFDETTVTVDIGGQEKVFARDAPALRSLTHGYVITSHASQGKTASHVIAAIDSTERNLASQTAFYVSISRSAEFLAVVVDDKGKALGALLRNAGLKSSALEAKARIEAVTGLDEPPSKSAGGAERDGAPSEDGRGAGADHGHEGGGANDPPAPALDREISL